jgi:lysophospholipase L1-like esterase
MGKKLTLSLLAVLLALAAAEIVVRLSGTAPELGLIRKGRFQLSKNPRIGYEPVPNLRYHGEDLAFYDYQGGSNRLGYRDVDHAIAKPAGVFRIAVLGDSIASGFGVEKVADVFSARLEQLLRAAGRQAEVLNFAVSGYDTRQEVETLRERALAFQPDLVLLAYSLNDRERADGDILATLRAAERGRGASPVLMRSALYRLLHYRRQQLPRPGTSPAGSLPAEDTVAESFAELASLSRQHGFRVLVAVFPRFGKHLNRFPRQHDFVRGLAETNGFDLLDLRDTFRRCRTVAPEIPIATDTWHPSAYGHRCAAEAMASTVVRMR